MARKKAKTQSPPKKLTQTTLLSVPGSSTMLPSPEKRVSTFKSQPKKPSQRTVKDQGDNSDTSSDVGEIRFEKEINLSSEDDQPRLSPMKKRRIRLASDESVQASRVATPENSESHDDETSSRVCWRGKVNGKQRRVHDSDSEGEKKTKKRRLVRGVRPPSPEDDDDILDEIDENQILDNRMRRRDKKTNFQRNLEKLKRRKQGQAVSESSQSEGEEDNIIDEPFEGAKPDDDYDCDPSDGGDEGLEDSFIIQDGNTVVPQLPAMFSMNTHQDLVHHFKIICQLFVHLAMSPAKKRRGIMKSVLRDNEYLSLPLQIARRKLSGLRDSLVASSVWRPEFKKALETYPNLNVTMLDFAVPACDACHLGGRMSTRIGRLSGSPYDKIGYKPLDDSDSESEDSDDVREKPKIEFHLGRFCAKRTQVFHQFSHWEHDLFKSLHREVDELRNSNGKRGFVRVAFAKGIRPPENSKDADSIMDWLDERKIIEMEWVKVKDMMERARNLDMAAKKGEGD